MFILFSPYSFLFFSIYIFFLFSLSIVSNFYYFWSIIELIMLVFIGLSYTLFISSYSQLIMYFLIQALSSFIILVFYIYNIPFLLTLSLIIKLSIFPFFIWFINVVYRFPNFILFLVRTLHKIPVILLMYYFSLPLNTNLLWLSIILTTLVSGIIILRVYDFRIILVLSSVGNNSWFILAQISGLFPFLFFILLYSLSLYLLLSNFNGLSKPLSYTTISNTIYSMSFWVISLSGMPPFPLFYGKMIVIYFLYLTLGYNFFIFLFLVFNSLIFIAYLQSIMKYFIYVYTSRRHFILKY